MTQNSYQLGFMVVLLKLKRLTFVLATPKLGEMYNDTCCSKICFGTFSSNMPWYNLVKEQKQLPICAREEVKSMSILQLPGLAGYQAFAVLHKK